MSFNLGRDGFRLRQGFGGTRLRRPIFLLVTKPNDSWDGTEAVPPIQANISENARSCPRMNRNWSLRSLLHNKREERPFVAHRASFAVRVRSLEFGVLNPESCILYSVFCILASHLLIFTQLRACYEWMSLIKTFQRARNERRRLGN